MTGSFMNGSWARPERRSTRSTGVPAADGCSLSDQVIRQEGPQTHRAKAGTPTMGGLLILSSALIPTLLWANLTNPNIWIAVIATAAFGGVGFADDYLKIVRRSHHGLWPRYKMGWQVVIGVGVGLALLMLTSRELYNTHLVFPFFKRWIPDLGWLYVLFAMFVCVSWSNAVNLTDGLDGLAIRVFGVAAAALTALTYVSGHRIFAEYLQLQTVSPLIGELTIFCGALVGASLGFLWYNAYPAQVFMGDTGSLTLGGVIAVLALAVRKELLIPVLCGIFLVENLSVMLQVSYFKYTKKKYGEGRRIFLMSPLHHHYQKMNIPEAKIVTRFWIIGILLAILTLATLKLR